MDVAAIAALSVNMNMAQTQQELSVSVLKMAMASDTSAIEEALDVIESLDPALGNNIDITA